MLTLDLVMDGAPQSVMEVDTAIIDITFVPRTYDAEELSEQCVNAMLTDAVGTPPTMHMHCFLKTTTNQDTQRFVHHTPNNKICNPLSSDDVGEPSGEAGASPPPPRSSIDACAPTASQTGKPNAPATLANRKKYTAEGRTNRHPQARLGA